VWLAILTTSITQKSGDFPQLTELIDGFYPRFEMGDFVGPWSALQINHCPPHDDPAPELTIGTEA